jgi:hypothetical protein
LTGNHAGFAVRVWVDGKSSVSIDLSATEGKAGRNKHDIRQHGKSGRNTS